MAFGKKYFFEKLMSTADRTFTLQLYVKKQFLQTEFYNRKTDNKKYLQLKSALEFVSKEFKKSSI
jgi:hypothetical protein